MGKRKKTPVKPPEHKTKKPGDLGSSDKLSFPHNAYLQKLINMGLL